MSSAMDFRKEFGASLGHVSAKTLRLGAMKVYRSYKESEIKQREKYAYDELTQPHGIRLLTIKEGPELDPIRCDTYEVSLDDHPVFEALSYTWDTDLTFGGEQPPSRTIELSGLSFLVKENLYHALTEFRRARRSLPIWIDAVCINQQNNKEKGAQLAIMDRIYSQAKRVVIWLGKASAVHEFAIKFMCEIPPDPCDTDQVDLLEVSKSVGSTQSDSHFSQDGPLHPEEQPQSESTISEYLDGLGTWAAVQRVLRRSWFSRTWTLQELLLAKEVVILMGSFQITPETIVRATKKLLQYMENDIIIGTLSGQRESLLQHHQHLISIPAFFQSRSNFGNGMVWTLEEYALVARTRAVTKPQDKVFAGLSIAEGMSNFPVDYESSTAEVYIKFASSLIKTKTGMFTLSLVGDTTSTITDLPSWVPDLLRSVRPKPLRDFGDFSFHASSPSSPSFSSSIIQEGCFVSGHILHLMASEWDEIKAVSESSWPWLFSKWSRPYEDQLVKVRTLGTVELERLGVMFALVNDLGKEYEHTNEPTISAFYHTLIGGMFYNRMEEVTSSDMKKSFQYYICNRVNIVHELAKQRDTTFMKTQGAIGKLSYGWNYMAPLLEDAVENLKTRFEAFIDRHDCEDFSLKQVYAEEQERIKLIGVQNQAGTFQGAITGIKNLARTSDPGGSIQSFDSIFERIYDGRRLFLTKKGYLGLGVESVREGDTVVLVAGADVPYVIRSLKEEPLSYTLVGEAYIHGIMHGEAIKDASIRFEALKLV